MKELRAQNAKKLEHLEEQKAQLQGEIKALRMQLVGSEPEIVGDIDKEVGKLRVKLQRVVAKQESLSGLLLDVQTGVTHFTEQLEVLQIDTEEHPHSEDAGIIDTLKRLSQKAKLVYQVIERNRHFNELCKSKAPLVSENELLNGFSQSLRVGNGK